MKTITHTICALLLSSGAAFAMSQGAIALDTNGDGLLTIDEVQAIYPDVSTDTFSAMDLNADGTLDADEVTAAEEAGVMPTAENQG